MMFPGTQHPEVEYSSDFKLRWCIYVTPSPESLDQLRKFVESGVNVHARSGSGWTALMCAALADDSPNTQAFSYLFDQQEQPYSLEEKIDGLELLGASYILNKNFSQGIDCWLDSALLRLTPKVCVPLDVEHFTFTIPRTQCEWTTSFDLAKLKRDFTDINDISCEMDLVCQAMLVRKRVLNVENEDHLRKLSYYATSYYDVGDYSSFVTMAMFCLDWAKAYGGTFCGYIFCLLRHVILELTMMSSPDHTHHHVCNFSTNMKILEWIAVELKSVSERRMRGEEDEEPSHCEEIFLDCVIQLAVILSQMSRDSEQDFRFKKCLYSLVKSNCKDQLGCDLILLACSDTSYAFKWHLRPQINYSPLPSEKVVELLLEVGADPDSTDNLGNNGLHILSATGMLNNEASLVRLLLNHGAHWDRKNKMKLQPLELAPTLDLPINAGNEENTKIIPAGFCNSMSLKCLAAQVVRQVYSDVQLSHLNLPQGMLEFLKKH